MKTFTKMLLLTCWCLLSVSFAKEHIDVIKANETQQLIQEKNEALENQAKKENKVEVEEEADCEESSVPILIKVPEANKAARTKTDEYGRTFELEDEILPINSSSL